MLKRLLLALAVALLPAMAAGQQTVLQGGSWTSGLLPTYSGSGISQPIVQQSGTAAGTGVGIKEISVIARGTGTAPYAAQGSGQLGTIVQIQDAPSTNATGYHALSLSANAQGGGLLAFNAYGGASALPFYFNINGSTYEFPFSTSGVVGPNSSTVGHLACWNNTSGTLLSDCGTAVTIPSGTTALLAGTVTVDGAGTFQFAGSGSGNTRLQATAAASGTLTLPAATDTLVGKATTDTLTNKTLTAPVIATIVNSGTLTLPTSTDTLVGKATTDTFTNKTYDTAGTGNVFRINGQAVSAVTGATTTLLSGGTQITNSLGSDVNLNNTASYFDGPSIAQGSTGTWYATGTVTLTDTAGAADMLCKLWDGTTVIASGNTTVSATNQKMTMSLSGYLATPAGNIRVSCKDATSTSGVIKFNASGNSKDGTVSAFRVN